MRAVGTKSKTDASGIHLWLVLRKAFRSVEAHAHRHIAGLDMCLSDFGVLEVLLHKGPQNVKELGAKVMLTSGSMTAALDRLGRRGLIDREEDAGDRRARVVRLTEAGTALIREAFEDHKKAMESAVSAVSKRDREVLIDLLRRLGLGAVENAKQSSNKSVAVKNGSEKEKEQGNV
jgi:MarR family 2-MHQ and catechol resistance regulon transcriptional repressor